MGREAKIPLHRVGTNEVLSVITVPQCEVRGVALRRGAWVSRRENAPGIRLMQGFMAFWLLNQPGCSSNRGFATYYSFDASQWLYLLMPGFPNPEQ